MMLQSMHNATTLENLINAVYENFIADYGDSFQKSDEEDRLKENGTNYENLYLSLGVFGILFGCLVLALLFYILVKLTS